MIYFIIVFSTATTFAMASTIPENMFFYSFGNKYWLREWTDLLQILLDWNDFAIYNELSVANFVVFQLLV